MNKKYSYNQHCENSLRNCGVFGISLLRQNGIVTENKVIRLFCNSFSCKFCAEKKRQMLFFKIRDSIKFLNMRFLTITLSDLEFSKENHALYFQQLFAKFLRQIRKTYPSFKFVRITESHKSGYVHYHLLVNLFLPFEFLKKRLKAIEKNASVYIKKIPQQKQAGYLAKYLTKNNIGETEFNKMMYNSNLRRTQTSLHFWKIIAKLKWEKKRFFKSFQNAVEDLYLQFEFKQNKNSDISEFNLKDNFAEFCFIKKPKIFYFTIDNFGII